MKSKKNAHKKNPKRVAPQIRKQIRVQKNRIFVPAVIGSLCFLFLINLLISEPDQYSSLKLFLGLFGAFAFFSSFMDFLLLRRRKEQLKHLETEIQSKN